MLFISLVSSLIWKGKIKIKVCWERGTERAQSLDTDIARCTSCYLRIQESTLKKLHMAAENAVITTQFNIDHLSLLSFLQHQPDVDLTSLPCDAPIWVGCHWLTRRLEMIHLMLLRPDLSSTKWFSSFGLNLDNDICFFCFVFLKGRFMYVRMCSVPLLYSSGDHSQQQAISFFKRVFHLTICPLKKTYVFITAAVKSQQQVLCIIR